jgi:hypothetical protein
MLAPSVSSTPLPSVLRSWMGGGVSNRMFAGTVCTRAGKRAKQESVAGFEQQGPWNGHIRKKDDSLCADVRLARQQPPTRDMRLSHLYSE